MPKRDIADIIAKVKSPIGFFALCILLAEGLLIFLVKSDKFPPDKIWPAFVSLVVVFGLTMLVVAYITYSKPGNLGGVPREQANLRSSRQDLKVEKDEPE